MAEWVPPQSKIIMDALKILLTIIGLLILLPIFFYLVVAVGAAGSGAIICAIVALVAVFSKK
jgi:hypothetical protein